ncbi:class I fructose-bisphosphate aldolase [Oceanobacillus jeddahense]|uniref:class I fructose-bisphosphate aldolase n=1 Tax=Oceanobacillus jeddahense TaxID=1462527 RepID=UPI000595F961|nr:phospho-2-dehydro-3-deoxyheptonate aldolase [Oceanobacillus jeddahense]
MSKNRRLARVFSNDKKTLTLALDGYYFTNKTDGIDKTISQMPELVENGLDAVLVTPGIAKKHADAFTDVGMLVRADMSTNLLDPSVPDTFYAATVEDALKLGADGVVNMTFPGADNEASSHQIARDLARASDNWNTVFMCETLPFGYPVTNEESNQASYIAAGARVGTELGADIIKTRFSGEPEDKEIVEAANAPVVALGGPKTENIIDYFAFVRHCMDVGASGVAVGRNITQNPNPAAVVAALNQIIHHHATAEEANEMYNNYSS